MKTKGENQFRNHIYTSIDMHACMCVYLCPFWLPFSTSYLNRQPTDILASLQQQQNQAIIFTDNNIGVAVTNLKVAKQYKRKGDPKRPTQIWKK